MQRNLKTALRLPAFIACLAALFALASCNNPPSKPGFINHRLPEGAKLIEEHNGIITQASLDFHYESDFHPGLKELREREGLDQVVSSGKDEFEKMLLLRDWAASQWSPGKPKPYPRWDARESLDRIREGRTSGFCAQYAVVMVQSCLALGWQARYLSVASRDKPRGGHSTVEVWSNQFNKWVALDPFFGAHFLSKGVPLSALELHSRLVRGDMAEVQTIRIKGAETRASSDKQILDYFWHLAVDMRNDHLSRPLHFWDRREGYLSWRDGYSDGRPQIFNRFCSVPDDFEFPLNQVEVSFDKGPKRGWLRLRMRTNMPDAETLMVHREGREWRKSIPPYGEDTPGKSRLSAELDQLWGSVIIYYLPLENGNNLFETRAVSRSGVEGPVFSFEIQYSPGQ